MCGGEIEFYADDIETNCPVCGSNKLVPDATGTGVDIEIVGITCLNCYTSFGYRAACEDENRDTVDDDDIPW